jgi:hypothetical protein
VPAEQVPAVIEKMKARLDVEAEPALRKDLWAATYVLLGLRFESQMVNQLLQGVMEMEESSTYQYILEKGALKEARQILLRLGTKKFGLPDAAIKAKLESLSDHKQLDDQVMRVMDVSSWEELLA